MARTLSQIIAELNPTYAPQEKALRERQALIPTQIAEEEKGLEAKQGQAFGEILGGARRRGLGFSGIPLSEQAQYTSTEFLPALARLRGQGREQALSLEEAILGIGERRNTLAQQLRQSEQDRAEQQRQFNINAKLARQQFEESKRQAARAASGGAGPSFGGGGGGGSTAAPAKVARSQRKDGGFNFTYNGQPISAAKYAQLTGTPFIELLNNMAKAGDNGAAAIKGFVGNDFGIDRGRVNVQGKIGNIYNSLVWGVK